MQKQFQRFVKQVEKNKREAGRAKKKKQILTTYSGYKKSQVLSDLEKAIINSNIEKTTRWTAELILSNIIKPIWDRLIKILPRFISVANPQLPIYLYRYYERFNKFYNKKTFNMVRDMNIVNLTHDIVYIFTACPKKKLTELPNYKNLEFNLSKLRLMNQIETTTLKYIEPFLKEQDPKEIIIPVNEFIYNLYSNSNSQEILNKCCYWIQWVLVYNKNYHKNKMECASRENISGSAKNAKDCSWIFWEAIIDIMELRNLPVQVKNVIYALFKIYRNGFNTGKRAQRIYLLILATQHIINPIPGINYNVPIITNYKLRVKILSNLMFLYKDIIQEKKKPNLNIVYTRDKNTPLVTPKIIVPPPEDPESDEEPLPEPEPELTWEEKKVKFMQTYIPHKR